MWSLASDAAPSAVAVRCRGEYVQSLATDGYLPIAAAQQKNVAQLGGSIAAALGALGAGATGHLRRLTPPRPTRRGRMQP